MKFVLTGAKNAREVVFTVLRDSCIGGDLTVPEAVEVAKDLFARNSINFYKITNKNWCSSHNICVKTSDYVVVTFVNDVLFIEL